MVALPACQVLFPLEDTPSSTPTDGSLDADAADPDLLFHLEFDNPDDLQIDATGQHAVSCPRGCPIPALDRNGKMSAARFDANASTCLQITEVEASPDMTFALWAKVEATGHVFSRPRDGALGTNAYEASVVGTTVAIEVNGLFLIEDIELATWVHVAGRFKGDTFALFVGGAFVEDLTTPALIYGDEPVLVGCEKNGSLEMFVTGDLDEVRLYRRALTDLEIQDLAR